MGTLGHTQFLLMLLETPGIGSRSIASVIRRNAVLRRSADEVLSMRPAQLAEEYGVRIQAARRLLEEATARREQAESAARWLSRHGVSLLTEADASYPERLRRRMEDPPPVLFAYGSLDILSTTTFAVASSNGAAEPDLAAADRVVAACVENGWTLAAGHNRIGYQRPALAARRNGGRVCYVLDRGLLHGFGGDLTRALFPAARIWGPSFDPASDLALSPFALRAHGIAQNNRRRDSVVFALADVVFAAGIRPGGRMEGECLRALGRDQVVAGIGSCAETLRDAGMREIDPADAAALSSLQLRALRG